MLLRGLQRARRDYNRAKRAARRDHELQQMHASVTSCRTNPRRLWEKLLGGAPPCALTDMEVWRRHFAGLLTGGVERDVVAEHQAHGILTYVICGMMHVHRN